MVPKLKTVFNIICDSNLEKSLKNKYVHIDKFKSAKYNKIYAKSAETKKLYIVIVLSGIKYL